MRRYEHFFVVVSVYKRLEVHAHERSIYEKNGNGTRAVPSSATSPINEGGEGIPRVEYATCPIQ
jgi:hypothetical protein